MEEQISEVKNAEEAKLKKLSESLMNQILKEEPKKKRPPPLMRNNTS